MSRYLIDRIAGLPNVDLVTGTEVVELEGDRATGLSGVTLRDRASGATRRHPLRHLFLFIGADPNATWLSHHAAVDEKGFLRTGLDCPYAAPPAGADARRAAMSLETSVPGIFAIGDVRSGSIKRVAAAVVAQIHSVLALQS